MTKKNYLLLLRNGEGYPFGVVAYSDYADELHGPFESEEKAEAYIAELRAEYDDYTAFKVVKIEMPEVTPKRSAGPLDRKVEACQKAEAAVLLLRGLGYTEESIVDTFAEIMAETLPVPTELA